MDAVAAETREHSRSGTIEKTSLLRRTRVGDIINRTSSYTLWLTDVSVIRRLTFSVVRWLPISEGRCAYSGATFCCWGFAH